MTARPEGPTGLLVVDKPADMTSHDVVSRVRRLARTRKVGHAGTLDPAATGVLVLALGRGTRLLGHLGASTKSYSATLRLGASTTTDDAEGEPVVLAAADALAALTEDAVRSAAAGFEGEQDQVPSSVSAVKVEGRRSYERVRAGEQVALPARRIHVSELTVRDVRPGDDAWELDVDVVCSAGTYVRALARDLGAALGVGGHLRSLRRTRSGAFTLDDALTLDELARRAESGQVPLLPLADAVRRSFDVVTLDAHAASDVGFGRALDASWLPGRAGEDAPFGMLSPEGAFLALYRREGERAVPVAVFAPAAT